MAGQQTKANWRTCPGNRLEQQWSVLQLLTSDRRSHARGIGDTRGAGSGVNRAKHAGRRREPLTPAGCVWVARGAARCRVLHTGGEESLGIFEVLHVWGNS